MERGISLVELLVALACSSILFLIIYQFHQVSSTTHAQMREAWYCMQSLRQATISLNADMIQCAYLLPQDLRVAAVGNELFIAGVPVTSENPGLRISLKSPPPYYARIDSSMSWGVQLDTTDIDGDSHDDFWADLGVLTDCGPCMIGPRYKRGMKSVPLKCGTMPSQGQRAVPAIHYDLRGDGLYRNDQLLAEAVVFFEPRITGHFLNIDLRSRKNGTEKTLSLSYAVQ